jgi:rhodanese-related sulfurtransferase
MHRIFLCLAFVLLSQDSRSESPPVEPPAVVLPPEIAFIAPADVQRHLVEHPGTQIIDVRTAEEREKHGYILNSLHLDHFHGQQTLDALAKLDHTKPCIVYCAIGGRAKLVAIEMHKLGFKNILLLKGGFNIWTASGQAVAK